MDIMLSACKFLVSPVVGSGRVEDEPRAHEASVSFNSLNVRLVFCLSRHGFNVWLQPPLSGVHQEVRLRPAAANGCRLSHLSVRAPNRLSANLSCGVAIVCRTSESVLTPIILLHADRLAAGRVHRAVFAAYARRQGLRAD